MHAEDRRQLLREVEIATELSDLHELFQEAEAEPLLDRDVQDFLAQSILTAGSYDRIRGLIDFFRIKTVRDLFTVPGFGRSLRLSRDGLDKEALRKSLVVAFRLWFRQVDSQRLQRGSPLAGRPRDRSALGLEELSMARPALRKWAEEKQVQNWLQVGASVLEGRVDGADRRWLQGLSAIKLSVEDVICGQAGKKRGLRVPLVVLRAAWALLDEAAVFATESMKYEQELDRRDGMADLPPRLEDLRKRLLKIRAEMRRDNPPHLVSPDVELSVSEHPPSVHVADSLVAWCSGGSEDPVVTIDLEADDPGLLVQCSCKKPKSGGCSLRIGAIDLVRDFLLDGNYRDFHQQLLKLLGQPAWEVALDEVDRLLAEPPVIGLGLLSVGAETGWRVEPEEGRAPTISLVEVQPKKSSTGFKTRLLDLNEFRQNPELFSRPVDRQVADLLAAGVDNVGYYHIGHRQRSRELEARVNRVLDALVGHPRVFVGRRKVTRLDLRRASLDLRWSWPNSRDFAIDLRIDGKVVPSDELAALVGERRSGDRVVELDVDEAKCRVIRIDDRAARLVQIIARGGRSYGEDARAEWMRRLPQLSEWIPIQLDESLRGRAIEGKNRPLVQLTMEPDGICQLDWRWRPIDGAKLQLPGEGSDTIYGDDEDGPWYLQRALGEERRRVLAVKEELMEAAEVDVDLDDARWEIVEPAATLRCVQALQSMGERLDVEWLGSKARVLSSKGARDLKVSVNSLEHWFSIDGKLQVENSQLELALLLDAVREKKGFVQVDDDTWLRIESQLAEQLQPLADALWSSKNGMAIAPIHSLELEALAALGAELDLPPEWTSSTQQLLEADSMNPPVPRGLRAELRDYQKLGFVWLSKLATWAGGACLADDMGLGKTVQALALLLRRKGDGPALVVAPTSVLFNWQREAERFAPSLRVLLYRGPERDLVLDGLGDGDVVLTNYALLARSGEALGHVNWATVVLDEAQAIKNPDTHTAKAAFALKAGFRLALTGTPVENRTGDLWSLFRFLMPGYLGSRAQFRGRFVLPIERDSDLSSRQRLAQLVRPFVLRRLKSEVASELPPRTEVNLHIRLSRPERALYEQERLAGLAKLTINDDDKKAGARHFQALAALTRLRQLACHPRLVDPTSKVPSAKLRALRGLLAELLEEGHSVLVFSQFTKHLALVREALEADGVALRYLDGSTPMAARRAEIDAFQGGSRQVFLISLKAGGTGLNLTAASYVVLLDPWWNPAVEDQASDRSHRIGQDKPVTIYRMISVATIEATIVDLQQRKRDLVAGLLEGTGAAAGMQADELIALIRDSGENKDLVDSAFEEDDEDDQ